LGEGVVGVWFGGGLLLVVHPLFHPLPGLTHFLCLAKESKQRKARPMRRSNSLLSFSSPQQKSKAPHRAGTSKAKPSMNQRDRQGWAGLGWAKQRGMPDEVVPGHSRVWPFLP
jgi:hypothetical protein